MKVLSSNQSFKIQQGVRDKTENAVSLVLPNIGEISVIQYSSIELTLNEKVTPETLEKISYCFMQAATLLRENDK